MDSQIKQCQNCKKEFIIEPDDFAFYEKIKVPAPTFCPECSLIRRMSLRNERTLYKRKCNAPGHSEGIISVYAPEKSMPVFDQKYWWSDDWDASDYGAEYDFSKPFFKQFHELEKRTPAANLSVKNSTNCEYCNVALDCKNCYFYFGSGHNEDCSYSNGLNYCRDCVDCGFDMKLERCYEAIDCFTSYNISFSQLAIDCSDSMFLMNCRNCSNCFGCINLRNKSYCIFNEQYSKDDYRKKISELNLGSYSGLLSAGRVAKEFFLKNIFPWAIIVKSQNVSGNNIYGSKNIRHSFDVFDGIENGKDLYIARTNSKDMHRSQSLGWGGELAYEDVSVVRFYNVLFSVFCWDDNDILYCNNCHNCQNLFGCVGLRSKQYCILNKQYTKEEYEALVPKIIQHMDEMPYTDRQGKVYKYGEFFPSEISMFAYNETIAQEYFPLIKEATLEKGYAWRDPDKKEYKITRAPADLPDRIDDADESILKEVIGCVHEGKCNHQCTTAFKIIESELQFYKKINLSLPRLCPNCRHYERLKQRNPLKLWHRKCMHEGCQNEFETSYAPDRPEIVYCEQCYNAEVA